MFVRIKQLTIHISVILTVSNKNLWLEFVWFENEDMVYSNDRIKFYNFMHDFLW